MNRLVAPLDAALDAVDASWRPLLRAWRDSPAGRDLVARVDARLALDVSVYPARPLRALELTPLPRVRVLLLGQDPYHGPDQAEGLAFSVPAGTPLPPSLRNIFRELTRDTGVGWPAHGHLGSWAGQGVLLLNTILTVEDGRPGSHARLGWEVLTDKIIETVAASGRPCVFMLWGAHAQAKAQLIGRSGGGRSLLLTCNHPSPLSATRPPAPFAGCAHFSRASEFLRAQTGVGLDWSLG